MSAFFNRFPYTNLNDINLDWIIKRVKKLGEDFAGQASDIAYAVLTANHASATATSARNAAQIAQNDAINALERANSVQGIAANALAVAQDASDTAESAQSVAEGIAGTAAQAVTIAQGASATAADALTAAQTATETAQGAVVQAQTATAQANNAAQSAQTAINTADAALTIASSAGGLNFTDTASGDIAEFPDGMELPAINVTAEINPNQDLHGYANPWPAGGGKNLFDSNLASAVGSAESNGLTFAYDPTNQTFSVTGTATANAINAYLIGGYNNTTPAFILKAGTYTFSVTDGQGVVFYSYDGTTRNSFDARPVGNTYTLDADTPITGMKPINHTSGNTYNESFQIQIESGSAKSSWAPYENICTISGYTEENIVVSPTTDAQDGTIYNVQFTDAGVVYGGLLDVTNGTLTVDRVCVALNNETWTLQAGSSANPRRFSKSYSAGGWPSPSSVRAAISSHFTANGYNQSSKFGKMSITGSYFLFADSDSRFSTAADFQAWVHGQYENGTPVQVSYKIAEPQTYQLTPTEIKLLFGNNCVWNDTNGATTVEYHADPQKWIEKKLNET